MFSHLFLLSSLCLLEDTKVVHFVRMNPKGAYVLKLTHHLNLISTHATNEHTQHLFLVLASVCYETVNGWYSQ